MKTYHWKEYGFIGTMLDFAQHFGVCKSQTFVNAVRRVFWHVYNCMEAREQADYEEKRERIKPAFRLYLDREHACLIEITKEEYEAIALPVIHSWVIGTIKKAVPKFIFRQLSSNQLFFSRCCSFFFLFQFLFNRIFILYLELHQFSFQIFCNFFVARLTIQVMHFGWVFLQII